MRIIFLIGCALLPQLAFSQSSEKKSVVIGSMSSHPNALLVLNPPNNDQGILLPQLTSAQRQSIAPHSPDDDGLIVFDTDDKAFYFWKQNQWTKVLGNDAPHQTVQFDPVSNQLSLTLGGGQASLSSLKEIPSTTGQGGKYVTTDGTSIKWSALPSLAGDVTGTLASSKVTKLQGIAISTTTPTDQQILKYDNASGKWTPATIAGASTFVAFKAAQNSNQPVGGTTMIVWDNELYDDGGNFNANQFKAPSPGLYHFDVLITIQNLDNDDTAIGILRVNATDVQHAQYSAGPRNNNTSVHFSTDIKLAINDVVSVWIDIQGGRPGPGPGGTFVTQGGTISTQFSGRKIY